MNSTFRILCVRHAESLFNRAQMRAVSSETEVRLEDEDLEVKYDTDLIDCSLSELGIQQCLEQKAQHKDQRLDFVLVSPLRRAIETAHYLFGDHPCKPKFVVIPELREMIMSSCDVVMDVTKTVKDFDYMDFSRLQKQKTEGPLILNLCENQDQAQKAKEYMESRLQEKPQVTGASQETYLMEYMRSLLPGYMESFIDTQNRIERLKETLKKFISECPEDSRVVCVTHSRTLYTLSASQFAEDGQPLDGTWWRNCEALDVTL